MFQRKETVNQTEDEMPKYKRSVVMEYDSETKRLSLIDEEWNMSLVVMDMRETAIERAIKGWAELELDVLLLQAYDVVYLPEGRG